MPELACLHPQPQATLTLVQKRRHRRELACHHRFVDRHTRQERHTPADIFRSEPIVDLGSCRGSLAGQLRSAMIADMITLEQRIRRLEDRAEIGELIVRYGIALDAHDMETMGRLYAPEGQLKLKMGDIVKGSDRESVLAYYADRIRSMVVAYHFCHGNLIEFDPEDDDRATGVVMAHAELWSEGRAKIAAVRYEDCYVRLEGRWCFAERVEAFLYFLPVEDYAAEWAGTKPVRMALASGTSDWTIKGT